MAIAVVFDISEKVDDFLESNAPIGKIVFNYYFNFIPYFAGILSPLLIFIAVIYFTAQMANKTEIVAILSSGVSFQRFLWPYWMGALLLAVVSFVFNGYLIPVANKTRIDFEYQYVKKKRFTGLKNIHLQVDSGKFIFIQTYNQPRATGYKFSLETFKGDSLKEKLMADRITWDTVSNNWYVENYSIRKINNLQEELISGQRKNIEMDILPEDFEFQDNLVETLTLPELDKLIEKEKLRGTGNTILYEIEKYKRWANPFAIFVLTLMGVVSSSRKVRGGIGTHLGRGIGLAFLFLMVFQFSSTFALKGGLHPIIAVWIPNITFLIYGLYLLKIAPK
ncbi:MAG: lipopolysaccharide export system permease protein [Sphingobacteriales bacterium]|jgi:lipopolysaccharide export system permease protein